MDFYQRMAVVCREIPRGKVATYGQIAFLCGKPRNARQVGYALRTGRAGENIPAHRIVNAKGELTGACYFELKRPQKELLESEGIKLYRNDKYWCVDLEQYIWRVSGEEQKFFSGKFLKVE